MISKSKSNFAVEPKIVHDVEGKCQSTDFRGTDSNSSSVYFSRLPVVGLIALMLSLPYEWVPGRYDGVDAGSLQRAAGK